MNRTPPPTRCLSVSAARAEIISALSRSEPTLERPVGETVGATLARAVASPVDIPACDNAAMDGFAFAADGAPGGERELLIRGESLAGHPHEGTVGAGECVRITTGAALPAGCDTVVPWEKVRESEDRISFPADVVRPGANVRRRGEEVFRGGELLPAGQPVGAAQLPLIGATGLERLPVRQPLVAVLASGDELVPAGRPCPPGHCYESNSLTLVARLRALGIRPLDLGIVPDRPEELRSRLEFAARSCAAVIVSGGASSSDRDFTGAAVADLGQLADWRVDMRPGRPMRFATIGSCPVFILPGNPVASFVTFFEFARGALLYLLGREVPACWPREFLAVTGAALRKREGRAEFQRGRLSSAPDGRLIVHPLPQQGSAAVLALARADCLIALPPEAGDLPAGATVTVHPLD